MEDTGIGISDENKPKLFKLFGFIKSSLHMNKHGIGLGLVIAKMVTNEFGGDMNFTSQEGEGSQFFFNFKILKRSPSIQQ